MLVRELIEILEKAYPDETVVLVNKSNRIAHLFGVNWEQTQKNGNLTLDFDWPIEEGRIVETELDKLKREKARIAEKIRNMTEPQRALLQKKCTSQRKSARTERTNFILEVMKEERMMRRACRPKKERKPGETRGRKKKVKTEDLCQNHTNNTDTTH